jgi:hypothetical protein
VTLEAVADNDVLIKGAAYGLLVDLIESVASTVEAAGTLGSARFVVTKRLERHTGIRDRPAALFTWQQFLARAEELEPTDDEIVLSTLIEETALRQNLPLDAGESQLCAIAIKRDLNWIVTGDKRAIAAGEVLLGEVAELIVLKQRLMCLEQAIARLVAKKSGVFARNAICAEPLVDRALSICFECASVKQGTQFYPAGLYSYIEYLRQLAPTMLASGPPNS